MKGGDPYLRCLQRLASMARFGVDLGLDRMEELLRRLGNPERALRCVHIAGTNGKGSTAAMIAAGLTAAGVRTGLYTSPHLCRFSERIRVDGKEIPGPDLACQVDRVLEAAPPGLTFFETATAAALLHFAEAGVEAAVLETGLGGRLDATNVVRPVLSVITTISLDHTDVLGDTLELVAGEKAGIIKAGAPTLAAPAPTPEVERLLRRRARQVGSDLSWVAPASPFTAQNRALALAAAGLLRQGAGLGPLDGYEAGVARARWPGRLERLADGTVLDGAHNPAGAVALAAALAGEAPFTVLLGLLHPREPGPIIEALEPLAGRFIFTAPRSPRAMSPEQLTRLVPGAESAPGLAAALEMAARVGTTTLVTGSLYLVGEARALLLHEPVDPVASWDPLERVHPGAE